MISLNRNRGIRDFLCVMAFAGVMAVSAMAQSYGGGGTGSSGASGGGGATAGIVQFEE